MADASDNLARITGGPLATGPLSVWSIFKEGLAKDSNAVAVISTHQSAAHFSSLIDKSPSADETCLTWKLSDIHQGASRIAAALEAQGVPRGSVLVTMLPNGVEWCLMFWVAAILQLTLVPLDYTLLNPGREEQARYFVDMLKPSTVIVSGFQEGKIFDDITADLDGLKAVKLIAEEVVPTSSSWTSLQDLVKGFKADRNNVQDPSLDANGTRIAAILFTSGTSTGRPKGCPITVSNMCTAMRGRSDFYHMHSGSRALIHTVNFRAINVVCSLAAWHNGGGVILAGISFNPRVTLQAIQEHKATWCGCVPALLHAMASVPEIAHIDSSSLELMALGGDVVTEDFVKKCQQLFPHSTVRNVLGMTEGSGCVGWPNGSPMPAPTFDYIPSCGRILPGSAAKICDNAGNVIARNVVGNVHLGGPTMAQGYLGGEQKELFYKDEQGENWIITGDQGVIDSQGWLYILGRTKDVIMRNAVPLSPAMIEVFVQRKFGVQSQVFGIPSKTPGVGEDPFVVIQTSAGSSLSQLPEAVASGLGKDYRPIAFASLEDLGYEDWPKNATGKVVKHELRERAVEWLREK